MIEDIKELATTALWLGLFFFGLLWWTGKLPSEKTIWEWAINAMNSRQRRIKWETIFLLDYLEKQRRLSPEMALCVLRLAVVVLHEPPGDRIAQSYEKRWPTGR